MVKVIFSTVADQVYPKHGSRAGVSIPKLGVSYLVEAGGYTVQPCWFTGYLRPSIWKKIDNRKQSSPIFHWCRLRTDIAMAIQKNVQPPVTIVFAMQNSKELLADAQDFTLNFQHKIKHIATAQQLRDYLASLAADSEGIVLLDPGLTGNDDSNSTIAESYLQFLQDIRNSHPSLALLPIIPEDQPALVKLILEIDIYYALHQPLNLAEITASLDRIHRSLCRKKLAATKTAPTLPTAEIPSFHGMIGTSETMQQLFATIRKVAMDNYSTVLIRGESGTGKEMVARAIHAQSERAGHNFVPVNCAAIPDDLLESELFGYTKGAFTGANANKPGRIQFADKGTLFLDEIGDMKHALQAKLLRVIQEREFEPVGAFKAIPVNTRILAATHCDLEALVAEGKFREDLYYRLSVIPLRIPPLRSRTDDIPYLINSFLKKYAKERGREAFSLSPQALAAVIHYPWRGNVRELENLVQQLTILAAGKEVEHGDLPDKFQDVTIPEDFSLYYEESGTKQSATTQKKAYSEQLETCDWQEGVDFNQLVNKLETELIVSAMRQTAGNKKEAARLLKLKRTTLLEKIKKKEIDGLWEE